MVKRKACKKCKIFVDGEQCPLCKGGEFSTNWQGRLNIIDPSKSMVAHKVGIKEPGEYVIKVK